MDSCHGSNNISIFHSQPAHPLKPKIFAVPHGEPSAQCTHGAMCFCWAAWWQDVTRLGHRKIHDSNQLDLCSDIYVELRSWNFSLEHELFFFYTCWKTVLLVAWNMADLEKEGTTPTIGGRNSEDILAIELADIADTFLDRWVCFHVYPRPAILITMKNRR